MRVKKISLILFFIIFIFLILCCLFFIHKRAIHYYWTNNYTETSVLKYISGTVREIQIALDKTIKESQKIGRNYKILYQSAYGSGFIEDNPIPNDLDYNIILHLGDFEYDGKNSEDVAEKIMQQIENFTDIFSEILREKSSKLYVVKEKEQLRRYFINTHDALVNSITKSIDDAISGNGYHKYTIKTNEDKSKEFLFTYNLNPGELILEEYRPIIIYGKEIRYNNKMKDYLRELSIVFCYSANIIYKGKVYLVTFSPESVFTEVASLENRLYASNIFIGNDISNYLENLPVIKDTNINVKYRIWAICRHFESVVYFQTYDTKPIKYLKRMKQLKDMLGPLLDTESQNKIERIVHENFYNRDIQLLNEYKNICSNWMNMTRFYSFYRNINKFGEVKKMDKTLTKIIDELDERGNVGLEAIAEFKYYQKEMEKFFDKLYLNDFKLLREDVFGDKYDNHLIFVNNIIFKQLKDMDELHECLSKCFKIMNDAGLYMLNAVWLDRENIGIKKNEFTKKIDNINKFAKENNLPSGHYKLVNASQFPPKETTVSRRFWVRYKSTPEEDKRYEEIIDILSKDKENHSLKQKIIYFY